VLEQLHPHPKSSSLQGRTPVQCDLFERSISSDVQTENIQTENAQTENAQTENAQTENRQPAVP
jgi:hypothetical protein